MNDTNAPQEFELDDALDALEELNRQERAIAGDRAELQDMLSRHRPEVLERIVDQVQKYLTIFGGSERDILDALPVLRVLDKKPTKKARGQRKAWRHEQTGTIYRGGALPKTLAEYMLSCGVDLGNKDDKKAWIEANCEAV